MERRAQVQSYVNQTKLQSKLNLQCNYFAFVERNFRSKNNRLGENCTWTDCLFYFQYPQTPTHSCIKVTSARMINYLLYDATHEKSTLHKRATRHLPKVPQKPKFIIELTHYAALCMDLEWKLFLWIWNVMHNDFQLPRHSCRNIYQTQYIIMGVGRIFSRGGSRGFSQNFFQGEGQKWWNLIFTSRNWKNIVFC